jgi:hypothetical protein
VSHSWKDLTAPCRIPARAKSAGRMIDRHVKRLYADLATPVAFRCSGCGCEWDCICTNRDEWAEVTCSSCYSETVYITKLRMTFHNWGEQNGGDAERDGRYNFAVEKLAEAAL